MYGVDKCPLCGNTKLVYNRRTGEVICKVCGYVVKIANIDMGPEWRSYEGDDVNKARTGPPSSPLAVDRGMGTVLGDIQTSPDESRKREIWMIKIWAKRASGDERNLQNGINALLNYGDILDVPKHALKRAAGIYRMALKKDLIRGRSIKIIALACLYLALRENHIPNSLNIMARKTGVSKKKLSRYYKLLVKRFNLKPPPSNPILYVRPIGLKLELPGDVITKAENVMRILRRMRMTGGKDPVGLAAVVIYLIANQMGYKITQNDVAEASGVTPVTVRNRAYKLKEVVSEILQAELIHL